MIANGRSIGDADGFCTYYSDNMLGRSSVDLCVVSTSLYPNIGQLVVLPKWECSDHLPVKFGWFASGCIIIIIIIIKGHSLRRACLQPATNRQNSKPRPPTTNARSKGKL